MTGSVGLPLRADLAESLSESQELSSLVDDLWRAVRGLNSRGNDILIEKSDLYFKVGQLEYAIEDSHRKHHQFLALVRAELEATASVTT